MQLPHYVADILSRFPVSWIEFFIYCLFVYFLVSLIVIGKYDSSQ